MGIDPSAPWMEPPSGQSAPVAADRGYHRRPRLLHFSMDKQLPVEVGQAVSALDVEGVALALSEIADCVPADIWWIELTQDPGDDMLAALAQRHADDALSMILSVSGSAIDPVCAQFGDCIGVTMLINPDDVDCLAALSQALHAGSGRLNSPVAEMRDRRIEQLQEEVSRIARVLARLSGDAANRLGDGARTPASPFIEDHVRSPMRGYGVAETEFAPGPSPISARDVRQIIRTRRMREEFFGSEVFADPAWDMLLDLYAAQLERHRVSVSSLCIASAVPATTALRWIKTLTETGVFERAADPHDGRRIFVVLSQSASNAMHRYFSAVEGTGLMI